MTNIKQWSKEDLIKRCQKLERENQEYLRLQSTYSLCLSSVLLEQHELLIHEASLGDKIEYWVPVEVMKRVANGDIKVVTEKREDGVGAAITLLLPQEAEEISVE